MLLSPNPSWGRAGGGGGRGWVEGGGVFKTSLEVEFKFLNYYFAEEDVLLSCGDGRGASVTFIINYGRVLCPVCSCSQETKKTFFT